VIVSASRRTDIPAFYVPWFMRRVRAGECLVPNPVNPAQVSRVSLRPEDVEAIVFWTRNPRPLMPHLRELDAAGHRYYFLYTLLNYPAEIDPACPALPESADTFRRLSECIGPDRVIWRYDPIVISRLTGPDFHRDNFARIAQALEGFTSRCIVSVVDMYRGAVRRLAEVPALGPPEVFGDEAALRRVLRTIAEEAGTRGIRVQRCAEERDWDVPQIGPGPCVDDALVRRLFGVDVSGRKDPAQRRACHCVVSRDIGAYDTCVYGCRYCYATSDPAAARANRRRHDPEAPSLLPLPAAQH
jgi:hypothetical protein